MMKKGMLFIFLLLISVSFASAAGLGDLFNRLDESTVTLSLVFIFSFADIFFVLARTMLKTNTTIAGVIAGTAAFGITYGINRTGFDFKGLFYNIGISEETFMTIVPIAIIAVAIFVVIKLKAGSLFVFAGLLIALSLFAYEKTLLIVMGIILLIAGFIFLGHKKKEDIIIRRR